MKGFEIYTKKDYQIIPASVIIIKNKYGWTFMYSMDATWYTNSTNDMADCPPEDNKKAISKIVKMLKINIKNI